MKTTLIKTLVTLPLVVALSGCVIAVDGDHDRWDNKGWGNKSWEERQHDNREFIDDLNPGMMYAQVRSTMGNPDFREAFDSNEDKIVVLFYRTDSVKSDGLTSKDECTPIIFKNGVLTSWGEKAYEKM